jgi:phosphoenolpyruvate carboxykinase (GTP)
MLPFCGYHMGDYFAHWISMGQKIKRHPKVFYVNWFRKDASNRFIWPGFKENMRVLKWVFERTENKEVFQELPIGHIPSEKAFDVSGLLEVEFGSLFSYSAKDWIDEVEEMEKYFSLFTPRIPTALTDELKDLKKRILSDA